MEFAASCWKVGIASFCITFTMLKILIIPYCQTEQIQCVAPLAANNLQSGLSSASLVASSTLRLWNDTSFFSVSNSKQEVWGRLDGLFQSLWGTAVRIFLTSADSSILAKWPNSISISEWCQMISDLQPIFDDWWTLLYFSPVSSDPYSIPVCVCCDLQYFFLLLTSLTRRFVYACSACRMYSYLYDIQR